MKVTETIVGEELARLLHRLQKENPYMGVDTASLYVEGYRDAIALIKGEPFAQRSITEMIRIAKAFLEWSDPNHWNQKDLH